MKKLLWKPNRSCIPHRQRAIGLYVRRGLMLVIGCLGLAWGIFTLPHSEAADEFWDIESRLLRFESFDRSALTQTLESRSAQNFSACDSHSQRALLLMEMPLAEAALRSGAADEFDRRIQSLETRSRKILACAPRQSFVWLLAFNLEILHGRLNQRAFDLLAMSYETSPNEAWISIRRNMVATPLVLTMPEPLRQKVLFEFQQLIRYGFVEEAARSYLASSGSIRSLLQAQIALLDRRIQKAFSDTLQRLRS
jgi:hypothetical protein